MKKNDLLLITTTIVLLMTFATITTAQTKKPITKTATKPSTQTNYPSVKIGDQEWMTKNLDVSTFRNGDPIPQAKGKEEWKAANNTKKPAWCYYHIGYSEISKYGGDPEKTKKYGKLYNQAAVNDKRGLAPKGWHIPNNYEWKVLSNKATISSLKSKSGWEENNGSNASGFNALPGGLRDYNGFDSLLETAWFWSSSTGTAAVINYEELVNNFSISLGYYEDNWSYVNYKGQSDVFRLGRSERCGLSVRCVKDIVSAPIVQEKKGPTAQSYYDNGNIKFESKDYKGAIEDYSNAINLSPNYNFCYRERGNAKSLLKDYNGAITDYKKAIELLDGNLDFISNCQLSLASTYSVLGSKNDCCLYLNKSLENGNKEAQKYIDRYCPESEPKEQSELTAQTNSLELRTAKQVLPLLMNDLSQESSYKNGITKLGYHTTGNNNEGGTIYTSDDNDWIIYNAPTKKNETTIYSLVYYSREIDNVDSVLSYLDGYYNDELYDGYGLETEVSHEMEFYFSTHKPEVLQVLNSGINKSLDSSKYYVKERLDKNSMIRGIRLVNKSENGAQKPYYTAFIFIQQEVRN
jgi:uncharacterized protein (TIGR02145 family)